MFAALREVLVEAFVTDETVNENGLLVPIRVNGGVVAEFPFVEILRQSHATRSERAHHGMMRESFVPRVTLDSKLVIGIPDIVAETVASDACWQMTVKARSQGEESSGV